MDDIRRLAIIAADVFEHALDGIPSDIPKRLRTYERPLAIADEADCGAVLAVALACSFEGERRDKLGAAADACQRVVRACLADIAAGVTEPPGLCGAVCSTPSCGDWKCSLPAGHAGDRHSMPIDAGSCSWPVEEPPVDALAAAERRAKTHLLASMHHLARAERAERALRVIREGGGLTAEDAACLGERLAQAKSDRDEARALVRRFYDAREWMLDIPKGFV